jgi:ribonuclease HI
MPYARTSGTKPLFPPREDSRAAPAHYLIAHSDGGARGNPGPAGYGVVIQDQSGKKVAHLSEYLGHQTNNFAEYQGLIAALEYAVKHGPKALKLISDSELLVRQIKGIYKVKNAVLQDLHGRAKELIAQLDWFQIGHALREHNRDADRLANEAMDKGMGRSVSRVPSPANVDTAADRVGRTLLSANPDGGKKPEGKTGSIRPEASAATAASPTPQSLEGIIRNGVVELTNGNLPEGTRVQVRTKKGV